MMGMESLIQKPIEKPDLAMNMDEFQDLTELPKNIESGEEQVVEPPDISFIERTSRSALIEQCSLKASETSGVDETCTSESYETKSEGLTEEEKSKIKEETGWSD